MSSTELIQSYESKGSVKNVFNPSHVSLPIAFIDLQISTLYILSFEYLFKTMIIYQS